MDELHLFVCIRILRFLNNLNNEGWISQPTDVGLTPMSMITQYNQGSEWDVVDQPPYWRTGVSVLHIFYKVITLFRKEKMFSWKLYSWPTVWGLQQGMSWWLRRSLRVGVWNVLSRTEDDHLSVIIWAEVFGHRYCSTLWGSETGLRRYHGRWLHRLLVMVTIPKGLM